MSSPETSISSLLRHVGKGSSKCRRKSVVYQSECQACVKSNLKPAIYIGETGRTLYERSLEHLDDVDKTRSSSHILKHWATVHPEREDQPLFKFKVLRAHSAAMDRQIHEAVRISSHGVLISKSEFRQNQIKADCQSHCKGDQDR